MRGKTRTDGNPSGERDCSIAERRVSPNSKHRPDTRLEIAAGEPDLEALRSVTREWLVPLLVDFARTGSSLARATDGRPRKNTNSRCVGRETRRSAVRESQQKLYW